jgi:hypothetical protein
MIIICGQTAKWHYNVWRLKDALKKTVSYIKSFDVLLFSIYYWIFSDIMILSIFYINYIVLVDLRRVCTGQPPVFALKAS